jgi:Zn-finger nucleic acid-binding protein
MTELLCPKDQSPMRVIERNGVTLERCMECGGIFLDRGELERLMRAENEFNARSESQYAPQSQHAPQSQYATQSQRGYHRDDDDDDDDRRYYDSQGRPVDAQGRPYKKKRRGFLEDLFDFG